MPKVKLKTGQIIDVPDNATREEFLALKQEALRQSVTANPLAEQAKSLSSSLNLPLDFNKPFVPAAPSSLRKEAAQIGKESILPLAGERIGALTGDFAPIAVPLGGAIGEGLNQLVGITKPSLTNIAISGLGAPVAKKLTEFGKGTLRWLTKKLPFAARALQNISREMIDRIPNLYRHNGEISKLYENVSQFVDKVEMKGTINRIDELLKNKGKLGQGMSDEVAKDIESLFKKLTKKQPNVQLFDSFGRPIKPHKSLMPEAVDFFDMTKELQNIGNKVGKHTGNDRGIYKEIMKTIHQDFEKLAEQGNLVPEALDAFKTAQRAAARNFFADDFEEAALKYVIPLHTKTNKVRINVDGLLKEIEKGIKFGRGKFKHIKSALSDGEILDIKDKLLTAAASPEVKTFGGFTFARGALLTAGGFSREGLKGAVKGSALNAGINTIENTLMSNALTNMMMTNRGRAFLKAISKGTEITDNATLRAIYQFAVSKFGDKTPPQDLPQDLQSFPIGQGLGSGLK